MRKLMIPLLITSGLTLSGCATVLPMVLGTVLQQGVGAAMGAATRGVGGGGVTASQQFQEAAINACRQQAFQYGQATVTTLQQLSSTTLRANGTIAASATTPQRSFTCSFRSDGQVTDFRLV